MIDVALFKQDLNNKKALILGLGKTGLSVANALKRANIDGFVFDDQQTSNDLFPIFNHEWDQIGCVICTPGIPLHFPAPHPIIQQAKDKNIPIIGDIEVFYRCLNNRDKTIAITGTNGKSTTVSLIDHIFKTAGIQTNLGGNFGHPVLDFDPNIHHHIIETSSYQLDLLDQCQFDIALLLNITPDHLDRHGSIENYAKAKKRIFKNAKTSLVCIDDQYTQNIANDLEKPVITFSLSNQNADYYLDGEYFYHQKEKLFSSKNFKTLKGIHNWQNAIAAYLVCLKNGIDTDTIIEGLHSFPGLKHRQQLVAEHQNITFINDSKATNAQATEKALSSYDHIYWIVGGQSKDGGLNGLEKYKSKILHSFLIGESENEFATFHDQHAMDYTPCKTMDKAVQSAFNTAIKNNNKKSVILLSPACASWDQFKNFEERGDIFISLCNDLMGGKTT